MYFSDGVCPTVVFRPIQFDSAHAYECFLLFDCLPLNSILGGYLDLLTVTLRILRQGL